MQSLVARAILTWGCRYMGVGLGIGLVIPLVTGGTPSTLFLIISPLYGAIVGAAVGTRVGRITVGSNQGSRRSL